MAEIRETQVERDEDGRVVDTKVTVDRPRRRGGGFGWGLLLGVILIAGAILAFAYTQGSFQRAGVEADQATAQLEESTETAVQNTGEVLEEAGDSAKQAADGTATPRRINPSKRGYVPREGGFVSTRPPGINHISNGLRSANLSHPAQHLAIEDRGLGFEQILLDALACLVVLDRQQMDFARAEILGRLPHVVARQRGRKVVRARQEQADRAAPVLRGARAASRTCRCRRPAPMRAARARFRTRTSGRSRPANYRCSRRPSAVNSCGRNLMRVGAAAQAQGAGSMLTLCTSAASKNAGQNVSSAAACRAACSGRSSGTMRRVDAGKIRRLVRRFARASSNNSHP